MALQKNQSISENFLYFLIENLLFHFYLNVGFKQWVYIIFSCYIVILTSIEDRAEYDREKH